MMDAKTLARMLEEMAELMELDGANPFRINAHAKAARAVSALAGDIETYIQEDRLTEIEGIGKGMAGKINEFHEEGKISELEELRKKVPTGLVQMVRIPGLGPKKAMALHEELGLRSVEELKAACEADRVSKLKGFGKKTQETILKGIDQLTRYAGRQRLDTALAAAEPLLEALRGMKQVKRAEIAGSLRRFKETVHDLDFVAATDKPELVMEQFCNHELVESVIARGETKASVRTDASIQADLRCVTEKEFPYALVHFTGSKEFNTKLRGRAKDFGFKLNEYGLFPEGKEKPHPAKSEEEVFKHLKLAYIHPEMREDMGEIEAAEKGKLPKLVTADDLRGIVHMHTCYSDGKPTPEDYAAWAEENGIEWMGISDHSQSLKIANGLSEKRVLEQFKEIEAANTKYKKKGVRLLKGIESDILADGSLDYPDDFLKNFEFVIVSIHTRFNMTASDMTARVIRALEHPATTILGHMTGRLLLLRDGFEIDQKEVIRKAAELGVAIEINANPQRLDLDWRLVHFAIDQGVKIAISPDAHAIEGLADTHFGIGIARKGWVERKHLLNALTAKEFLQFARARKQK